MDKNKLPQSLGLSPLPAKEPTVEILEPIEVTADTTEEDFQRARDNLFDKLEEVNGTIQEVKSLAEASENPRFYEVLGQMLKIASDLSHQIMNLHRQRRDIQRVKRVMEQEGSEPKQVTQNNLFVGTSNDLLELIKKTRANGDS